MRELPILFSAPMVRAILEGRKTVTRRVLKPQPPARNGICNASYCGHPDVWLPTGSIGTDTPQRWTCPYGKVGDRLWVRETTFQQAHPSELGMTERDLPHTWAEVCERSKVVFYRADVSELEGLEATDGMPWKPSIHMPKARARIWLEVTAVRVERLQDVTAEQAIAEGMQSFMREHDAVVDLRQQFADLWDGLAKPGTSWADNPWVWVVEFGRVEAPHA